MYGLLTYGLCMLYALGCPLMVMLSWHGFRFASYRLRLFGIRRGHGAESKCAWALQSPLSSLHFDYCFHAVCRKKARQVFTQHTERDEIEI